MDISERALLKFEIVGATWDNTVDPYFDLRWYGGTTTPLKYNGTYYTTYVNGSDIDGRWGRLHVYLFSDNNYPYNNIDITRDVQLNCSLEPIPVPGAALLGIIGLAVSGWRLRKKA